MRSDILPGIIAEWLTDPDLPALTPREAAAPGPEEAGRILAVVGPRRAGKTFFLYQRMADLLRAGGAARDEILFVDFEDYRLRDFRPEDMERLLAAFHQATGKPPRYLFFDEVHRMPHWSRVLRTLHNRRRYAITVTGSNAELLGSSIAAELRGRYADRLILPFSFREFLRHRGVRWTRPALDTPTGGLVVRVFDEYLRFGGFPELAGVAGDAAKRRLLQTYYDTVFYRDVLDRYGIRARHLLDLLMRDVLEGFSSRFSISAFAARLRVHGQSGSKRSIADYLRRLEEAFFLVASEKFDFSPRKRMMNPRKIYLMDTGFSLLGGAFSENRGRLLENVVALELFRHRRRFLHFRGKNECDFIVQEGNRPAEAWQVCWELSPANEKREIGGLLEARRDLGISRGGLLTYGQEETRRVGRAAVRVQPVWKWLLSAGHGDYTRERPALLAGISLDDAVHRMRAAPPSGERS